MEPSSGLRLLSFLGTDSIFSFLKSITLEKILGVKNFTAIKILPIDSKDWSNELLSKLKLSNEIEIHLPTGVYKGRPHSFIQFSEIVIMNLEIFTLVKGGREVLFSIEEIPMLVLAESKKPKRIKEEGWDCFWSGFENGHVVFYFDKPTGF